MPCSRFLLQSTGVGERRAVHKKSLRNLKMETKWFFQSLILANTWRYVQWRGIRLFLLFSLGAQWGGLYEPHHRPSSLPIMQNWGGVVLRAAAQGQLWGVHLQAGAGDSAPCSCSSQAHCFGSRWLCVLWSSACTTLWCCTVQGGCGRLGWGLGGTSAAQSMLGRHVTCPRLWGAISRSYSLLPWWT